MSVAGGSSLQVVVFLHEPIGSNEGEKEGKKVTSTYSVVWAGVLSTVGETVVQCSNSRFFCLFTGK